MSSLLPVIQGLVVGLAIQTAVLLFGAVYLVQRMRSQEAERRRRDRELRRALAAELAELRTTVRAARAEAATYLEAVFTGVRGLARNQEARPAAGEDAGRLEEPESELLHLRDIVAPGRAEARRRQGSGG